ncbi:MAG TPA: hypothetical protein VGD42_05420 [Lysobacter sp.]
MDRHRILPLVAALGLAPEAVAQSREWGIEGHYLHLDEARLGDARMSGREQGLRAWTPSFDLAGGTFAVGADYVYTHYSYTGLPTRNRDLHRLALPLEWTSAGTLAVTLAAIPTVASSSNVFKDLFSRGGSDDFNLYTRATVQRAPEQGWGWRLGAGYDDRFGDPQAWPVAVLLYRNSAFALELGWPATTAQWHARERLRFTAQVAPSGARWHVVSDERDGAEFDYTVEAWRASLGVDWEFAARWHLAAQLGSEFDRHHDFEDDTGARVDADAGSAAFAAVALRYGF